MKLLLLQFMRMDQVVFETFREIVKYRVLGPGSVSVNVTARLLFFLFPFREALSAMSARFVSYFPIVALNTNHRVAFLSSLQNSMRIVTITTALFFNSYFTVVMYSATSHLI